MLYSCTHYRQKQPKNMIKNVFWRCLFYVRSRNPEFKDFPGWNIVHNIKYNIWKEMVWTVIIRTVDEHHLLSIISFCNWRISRQCGMLPAKFTKPQNSPGAFFVSVRMSDQHRPNFTNSWPEHFYGNNVGWLVPYHLHEQFFFLENWGVGTPPQPTSFRACKSRYCLFGCVWISFRMKGRKRVWLPTASAPRACAAAAFKSSELELNAGMINFSGLEAQQMTMPSRKWNSKKTYSKRLFTYTSGYRRPNSPRAWMLKRRIASVDFSFRSWSANLSANERAWNGGVLARRSIEEEDVMFGHTDCWKSIDEVAYHTFSKSPLAAATTPVAAEIDWNAWRDRLGTSYTGAVNWSSNS